MSAYADALLDFRRRKDEHFAAGKGPIQADALAQFTGLTYFPPNQVWALRLPLEPPAQGAALEFMLETSTGQPRYMSLLGSVNVPLSAGKVPLSVFAPLGEEHPARGFIPFRDQTSGQETYGAGRYLDAPLTRTPDREIWIDLDFNMAYHPYCAYSASWTCPLPPPENMLPVAVLAGERLPPKELNGQ